MAQAALRNASVCSPTAWSVTGKMAPVCANLATTAKGVRHNVTQVIMALGAGANVSVPRECPVIM